MFFKHRNKPKFSERSVAVKFRTDWKRSQKLATPIHFTRMEQRWAWAGARFWPFWLDQIGAGLGFSAGSDQSRIV